MKTYRAKISIIKQEYDYGTSKTIYPEHTIELSIKALSKENAMRLLEMIVDRSARIVILD